MAYREASEPAVDATEVMKEKERQRGETARAKITADAAFRERHGAAVTATRCVSLVVGAIMAAWVATSWIDQRAATQCKDQTLNTNLHDACPHVLHVRVERPDGPGFPSCKCGVPRLVPTKGGE